MQVEAIKGKVDIFCEVTLWTFLSLKEIYKKNSVVVCDLVPLSRARYFF